MDVQGSSAGCNVNIVFRTDASLNIGTGHVMRCLTLADALREQGAACTFICRPHAGHLLDLITQRGHRAVALPAIAVDASPIQAFSGPSHAHWLGTDGVTDAADTRQALGDESVDWLVVDHYALDAKWERALLPACRRLMVIDDLADRPHDCDLLLDQNLGRTAEDYNGLTSDNATRLIGPQYALLRPEFAQLRAESLARRAHPKLKRLLITMGGVDKDNATGQVLDALKACPLPGELEITVVMGPHAPWLQHVQAQALQMPWATKVLAGVDNMAELMADSDLAIGAAGSTSWERCCLGLPAIQLVLANNQKEAASALALLGAVESVESINVLVPELSDLFTKLDDGFMKRLSERTATICNGRGALMVADFLAKTIINEKYMSPLGVLRPIKDDELDLMRSWRNAPAVRENMYTRHEISSDEHLAWWGRTCQRQDQQYLMYESNSKALGIVGFTSIDRVNGNCSWAFYAAPDAPKGTGSRMEFLALEHVFKDLILHKMHCEVLAFNTPVIKLHQKFGFQVEGILRQHHFKDGEYIDIYRLGILESEWATKREEMLNILVAKAGI